MNQNAAEMGKIMSAVLDGADPRRGGDERDISANQAAELNLTLAYVVAVGYLRHVLNGLHQQFGEEAAGSVVEQMAASAVGFMDSYREGA